MIKILKTQEEKMEYLTFPVSDDVVLCDTENEMLQVKSESKWNMSIYSNKIKKHVVLLDGEQK